MVGIDADIEIVGYGCRLPGAGSPSEFWQVLEEGRCTVTSVGADRFDAARFRHPNRTTPGRGVTFAAGVLDDVFGFDPGFFGISPREAAQMDPQQRLLLQVVWESLEDAGVPPASLAGTKTGVYVGASSSDYFYRFVLDPAAIDAQMMTGNTLSIISNRVSYQFDLKGPSFTVDTACSSSLVALCQACDALTSGEIDTAIVAGVNVLGAPYAFVGFSRAYMLSEAGLCRAFDADGDGYVRSEGAVALVLQRGDIARASGRRSRGALAGWGTNSDGRTDGLSLPSAQSQATLLRHVYQRFGVDPADLSFVEAHGTGTRVGDPAEASALAEILGVRRQTPLLIGSVKTNIGHLEPASGLAGVLKALLALDKNVLPASLHYRTPNPAIPFEDWKLRVASEATSLDGVGAGYAGVNSFGFGGSNAHVVLRRAPVARPAEHGARTPPLMITAASAPALSAVAARYEARLADTDDVAALARAAFANRQALEHRALICPGDRESVLAGLAEIAEGRTPHNAVFGRSAPSGGVVFAFSGNGSQWEGMGRAAYARDESFRESFARIDARFAALAGWSLVEALHASDLAQRLKLADYAQPLLFAIQVALAEALAEHGIRPQAVVGHSVGEVAAAHVSGALSLDDALKVIIGRSVSLKRIHGAGGMAAVVAPAEAAGELLARPEFAGVEIAAFNTRRSLTVSGPDEPLKAFLKAARERRWPYKRLDIDYPYHTAITDRSREELRAKLGAISAGETKAPFFSTVTGELAGGAELAQDYWWRNMRLPVRFDAAIRDLLKLKPAILLEIGPSPVLTGYIADIVKEQGGSSVVLPSLERQDADPWTPVEKAAARVLAHLPRIDAQAVAGPSAGSWDLLPLYPWQNSPYLVERSPEALRALDVDLHPLLGNVAKSDSGCYFGYLDPATHPWLLDHQVEDAMVLPAAAMLEIALAAAREARPESALELRECAIVQAMVFEPGVMRETMTKVNAEETVFDLFSRPRGAQDWTRHMHGRIAPCETPARRARPALGDAIDSASAAEVYDLMRRFSLHYGPAFRRLTDVARTGASSGRVVFAHDKAASPYILDPAILDSAWHGVLWLMSRTAEGAAEGRTFLPVRVDRLRVFQPGATVRSASFEVTQKVGGSAVANLVLEGEDGSVVADVERARFVEVALGATSEDPPRAYHTRLQPIALGARAVDAAARVAEAVVRREPSRQTERIGDLLDALARAAGAAERRSAAQALVAAEPRLASEAMLAAILARRGPRDAARGQSRWTIPSSLIEALEVASPRAAALRDEAFAIIERVRASWPKGRPLRVLLLGAASAPLAAHMAALIGFDGGAVFVAGAEGPSAPPVDAPPVRTLDLATWRTSVDRFDVAVFCDPLRRGLARVADADTLAECTAGGSVLTLRPAESAFDRLLAQVEAKPATPDEPASIAVARRTIAGPFGEIEICAFASAAASDDDAAAARSMHAALLDEPRTPLARRLDALLKAELPEGGDVDAPAPTDLVHAPHLEADGDASAALAQALTRLTTHVARSVEAKTRLWLALPGALRGGDRAAHMAAAIWGFARVAANETQADIRLLDVDPRSPIDATAETILREIRSPRAERELLIGPDGAFAPRIVAGDGGAHGAFDDRRMRLEIPTRGSLERLVWRSAPRAEPAAGEVEVEIIATGLNFRDIMWALGLLPAEALEDGFAGPTLGMEFAGRVTRIGAGVSSVEVGDDCLGFAPGAFASHVCVPAQAVVRRPSQLSAEAAATVPVTFLTSWYSLVHLARLQAGETVLIHGGAGGVGLAAVQIAKLLGAKIIATAGSVGKRAMLEDLGVDHVLDSRSLAFADDIRDIEPEGVDVVLNSLAGEAMERSLQCLRPFGRFVELGKRDYYEDSRLGLRPFRKNLSYFGVDADQLLNGQKRLAFDLLREIMDRFAAGDLHALPWRDFHAADVTAAFRLMQQSGHIGKILVRPPAAPATRRRPRYDAEGTHLVIGGLGGFGLALAERLIANGARNLVLAGRSGAASDDARARVEALRASGARVEVAAVDATDREALQRLLDAIGGSGRPLRGVFHLAMVLDDAMIVNLTPERIEKVLRPKIAVASALDTMTRRLRLDHFVMFSSATTIVGNPGQANYVAANAWLESLARERRRAGLPALAVAWGAISDAGYLARNSDVQDLLARKLGKNALSVSEALDGLEALLADGAGDAAPAYARLDWQVLTRELPLLQTPLFEFVRQGGVAEGGAGSAAAAAAFALMNPEEARTAILGVLTAEVGKILRCKAAEVDVAKPLTALGVDSLMGVELRLAAEERLGVEIPLLAISGSASLTDLAGRILAKLHPNESA